MFYPDFSLFDYTKWSDLLEKNTGITIPYERKLFLQTKIWSRMRELKINTFTEYWDVINKGVEGKLEWDQLVDRLTVHETSFFRHKPSYDLLRNDFSEIILRNNKFHYKIWSVGCATGEEAYSLAMLAQQLKDKSDKKSIYYGVTATDVSKAALSTGEFGIYSKDRLNEINKEYYGYLKKQNEIFSVSEHIRQRVAFGVFNLLKIQKMPEIKFDVIFCQNVLIYLNKEKKLEILDGFKRFLKPGGMLILNPVEIGNWKSSNMKRVNFKGTLAYKIER